MKRSLIAILAIAALLPWNVALAQDNHLETFYMECIDSRIDRCQEKGLRAGSESLHIRQAAEHARQEAQFYQQNKQRLAKEMASKNIGNRPHQVEHFLIESFQGNCSCPGHLEREE